MRHRSVVPRSGGGRGAAAVSVVLMALSAAALLAAALRAHTPEAPVARPAGQQATHPAGQTAAQPTQAAPRPEVPTAAAGTSGAPGGVHGNSVPQAAPEATSEVASEATSEVASEATSEVASEATPETAPEATPEATSTTDRWRAVLTLLDRRRARAYATLEARLLRRVYAPAAPVGRQDRALLRRYRERGLRVRGLRMRLLTLRVRERRGDRVALVVRERLAGASVRGPGARGGPPADDVDERLLVLRRVAGRGWRIGAVRPVAG